MTTLGYWLLLASAVAVGVYVALQAHYLTLDLIGHAAGVAAGVAVKPERCPVCADPLTVEVKLTVSIGWRDALKLRLAGPAVREQIIDEILLRLQQTADGAIHPENRS